MSPRAFAGLEFLDAAVLAIGSDGQIVCANPAAKNLFSLRDCEGMTLSACFGPASSITQAFLTAQQENISITEHELAVDGPHGEMYITLTVSPIEASTNPAAFILEIRHIDQPLQLPKN